MKVDKILRCICCPDSEDNGSIYYGMPQLKVTYNSEFWEAFCPKCGCGSMFQFKSQYLALKHWNDTQKHLRETPRLFLEESEVKDDKP